MVKRMHATWPVPKKIKKVHVLTKKQMRNVVVNPVCPDIPIKVRRSLLRRSTQAQYNVARPVYYKKKTELNPDYDQESSTLYMNEKYEIFNKIGQGCFGDVFSAYSDDLGECCALKVSNRTHPFADFREVQCWEKIPTNPNCVKFVRAWQQCYQLYIHMELCFTSLHKILVVNNFVREANCWDIFMDVANGLVQLHLQNLIHMDIKPANIMLTYSGVCKIGDFGLVCDLNTVGNEEQQEFNENSPRHGISVSEGDSKYVALEVLRERIYTQNADVFSLGLMMMEIASDATLPSSGAAWEGLREGALPLCYLRRKLSPAFRRLVKIMTAKEYTARPCIHDVYNMIMVRVLPNSTSRRFLFMQNWIKAAYGYPDANLFSSECELSEGPFPASIRDVPKSPSRGEMRLIEPSGSSEANMDRMRRVSRRLFDV